MTDEDFASLVEKLEAVAAESSRGYKLRVAGLAAIGFGYLGGVLAIALALLGVVIWGYIQGTGRVALRRVGVAVFAVILAIGRALWVRFERPEGREIERSQAPKLFGLIDELRRAIRAPRVHRVLIENRMNASVLQTPRLGVLGWQENSLHLGLPLLESLTVEQFRAVLAHEFGHLSGAHSRFSGWIYRVRATWDRLLEKLEEEDHWATFIFRPFFRWYSPYFSAYTFVLARANELEADADAAELTSPRALGDALISVDLKDTYLDHRFWPEVSGMAKERPEPDVAPYSRMTDLLPSAPDEEDARYWLPQYLARKTSLSDTHPCLTDRLRTLGVEARVPPAVEQSAAAVLLGEERLNLASEFDSDWRSGVEEQWRGHFESVQTGRERLAELDARANEEGALDRGDAWEHANLTSVQGDPDQARAQYVEFADRYPDAAGGQYEAGRALLTVGDSRGVEYIQRAMELSDEAVVPGCELVAGFLREHGKETEAEPYEQRRAKKQQHLDAIAEERNVLPFDATYLPHEVDATRITSLREQLESLGNVKQAWLIRKQLELSQEPLYVLSIKRRQYTWNPATWESNPKPDDLALQKKIADEFELPGETFVLVMNHRARRERELFTGVEGSQILP